MRRVVIPIVLAAAASTALVAPTRRFRAAALCAAAAAEADKDEEIETKVHVHSVLDEASAHLGDVGGTDLAADLALIRGPISFSPLERIALTANGNLQRILASYHDAPVVVEVLAHDRVSIGLWRRKVRLAVGANCACVASSTVTATTREAIELAERGFSIGAIFAELGGRRSFSLLAVGKTDAAFSRTYTLSNAHVVCHIEEVLPRSVFDAAFPAAAPGDWHPDAAAAA